MRAAVLFAYYLIFALYLSFVLLSSLTHFFSYLFFSLWISSTITSLTHSLYPLSTGRFIWPGFGENIRVLEWIFNRCDDRGRAVETPIGLLPEAVRGDANRERESVCVCLFVCSFVFPCL